MERNLCKKKILFITPLPPPVHGSAMVSQFIKDSKLIKDSFNCDFVNLSTSRKMDEIGKQSIMKIFRFLGSYICVFLKLLFNRYELCYLAITCHGIGFLKDAPFVLLCKLFGRKIVIHQHNKGMSKCVDKKPYKWLLPLVYKNTKVILLSWHLYEDIAKIVKREQILICPNGIPEISEIRNIHECKNSVPRLFFLSNLIESKGVYVLLDACKILKEKGYKFICDFVGGETKEINRAVFESAVKEKGLDEYVVYLGPKYGNEKERYWDAADVFVQPTYEDCFPLTIVEAMQHGKPVVSTDEGAIPDLVVDGVNGFVCERRNVDSLANALEILLKDKDLRVKMGIEGYNQYISKFTLNVFEKNMNDLFNKILN
jgi:glycosyltransferase involved in cell wall biosynthesis